MKLSHNLLTVFFLMFLTVGSTQCPADVSIDPAQEILLALSKSPPLPDEQSRRQDEKDKKYATGYRDLKWDDLENLQSDPFTIAKEFRTECERLTKGYPSIDDNPCQGEFMIGDEVVYWCEESHPVAGTYRKIGVVDNVARLTYRVIGEVWEGDNRLIWFRIVHESPGLWAAFPSETRKGAQPYYISLSQRTEITMLLDMSTGLEVKRYFFKINKEPSCEVMGYNGRSLLPSCSLNELFIPFTSAFRAVIKENIPLWGWQEAKWETSACSYRLERLASRCEEADQASITPSADKTLRIDDRIRNVTFSPKRVSERGVDYGGGMFETVYNAPDYARIPDQIDAGFNQVIGTVVNDDLFDGEKSVRQRMELYLEFCRYVRHAPVFYGVDFVNLVRRTDRFRSNFVGSIPHLDEPIVYFEGGSKTRLPQWKLKNQLIQLQDDAEKDRKGETGQSALVTGEFRESADKYIGFVKRLCNPLWEGDITPSFNYPASLAWYDVQAGAVGFIREFMGKYIFQEVAFLNYIGTGLDYTLETSIRLNSAFLRGAGCSEGFWGPGVYLGTPIDYRTEIMHLFYDEGARYFFIWSWYGDSDIEPSQAMELARDMWNYVDKVERGRAYRAKSECIILLPYGLYTPPVNYYTKKYHPFADRFGMLDVPEPLWKGYEELTGLSARLPDGKTVRDMWVTAGQAIKEKLEQDKRFDIGIVTDLPEEYYHERYSEVIYVR